MTDEEKREHHLKVLQEEAAICDACGLHTGRTKSVWSRGSPQAPVMIVGEAPGANEDQVGRPFIGAAGAVLDDLVERSGISSVWVYICNAVKCRPPENRRPTGDEIRACNGYLLMQVRLVRPKVIVVLGKTAVLALNNVTPLGADWAGRWFKYQGIPAIATYHPAYLLRTPGARKTVDSHFLQAHNKLDSILREEIRKAKI